MSPTTGLVPFLEPLRPDLERVEDLLQAELMHLREPLGSALRGALRGGKRLRPALVLLIGRVYSTALDPLYRLAAALSMLHTASLIHDDLLDGAILRRGDRALHTVWPAGATVLAGDYLLGRATALIADLEHPRVLKTFGAVLCVMCAGEIDRLLTPLTERASRAAYERTIEAKTASLFAAAAEMAGLLTGAAGPQLEALRRFGWELGMAFQIVDDVLDLASDEAQLGKPAGSDLQQGVITLPILYYLEQNPSDGPVRDVLAGRRELAQVQAVLEAIRASGAIDAALAEAQTHAQHSQQALMALPDNDARRMLSAMADYVVARRH